MHSRSCMLLIAPLLLIITGVCSARVDQLPTQSATPPEPHSAPAALRAPDVVRPVLPEDAAKEVAVLGARIAELESKGLTAESRESREAQDAALDEAIALAERVLAIRVEHQGNTGETIRWRSADGVPSEWHDVIVARQGVADLRLVRGLSDDDRASLVAIAGTDSEFLRLYGAGRYAEAQAVTARQLEVRRRVLGDEHRRTLNSINSMGILLFSQGRLSEAEPYFREALEGFRRVLGNEHPGTLISIENMGGLFRDQGRLSEAEPYYREALEGFRRVLGDEHPDTLTSINRMGGLLESQGRLSEAEPLYREALEGHRRVLGDEHRSTLNSINSMGALLVRRGRLSEAEPYFREALEGQRRVLGNEHPATLISITNMGVLLRDQGRLAEAELYSREALEGFRRVLGDEHPNTLVSIGNLGGLLRSLGRLSEAEPYTREALETRRRVLGDAHPGTLMSISNMGVLLDSLGRMSEVEPHHREALEGRRRVLGDEHPDTLTSINNMGSLLAAQGKPAEAEQYWREALATAERLRVDIAGDASARAQFAGALNLTGIATNYARVLVALQRADEALATLERGRGRAGLDLFAGGRTTAERALRATNDAERLSRYDAALSSEQNARQALAEAEARLGAAPDVEKANRRDAVIAARSTLSEKTASVFNELRGLVPAIDPMTSAQILASLKPGEALVTWAWTDDAVIALVVRNGQVRGVTLASDKDGVAKVSQALASLRAAIASRPLGGVSVPSGVLDAARDAATPESLRALLGGSSSVIAVTDGPLAGIPLELLLPETPVAYAPSATIALRPRLNAPGARALAARGGVVVGDPIFNRSAADSEDFDAPDTGVLLAMVAEGSNGAIAGLRRGDVLLTYGEHPLNAPADLGPAMSATAESLTTRGVTSDRPVTARVWRDGEEIEVALATGRMGVQMSQAPVAEGLRSMRSLDRPADRIAADAAALEQVRFYGAELSPLPATRLEASAVAAMLGAETTLLLGADATAPGVRKAVENSTPRVIHLATHGLLGNNRDPLLAGLALTTPEEPTPDDIGFLTLADILEHWGGQLRGVELVTLSACDTGRGVQQGDTSMALPLGLLVGGADSVLASLWKVDDRATALLMARFYANWLGKAESQRDVDGARYSPGQPMPKMAALREAQSWLRALTTEELSRMRDGSGQSIAQSVSRDPTPRRARLADAPQSQTSLRPYDHPFFWSAFVLYGDPE